ncbi:MULTISPECIES: hypothetical protein [Streptomyces]|uniref:Uncharacterized protein n=1 Tax=Streptomyces koelreuteriae TaxID=2838015 RepID=A0ABX8FTI0_9ACTN|nr:MULTISPECIES: hypothetical protein [Streptomyces]QWB24401.1 hypothetical protein KJK29_18355 [Streptomyces koelreuteriae]UUA07405.1 hypothetical protein NNW98_18460 [Streptomyces koelreuteriae]UUA15035.1 hypothetical protein NNW99_18455 [Streptomyces sp. CRCS-T-1]
MTPWLRALRATGLVVALGAGAVVSPCGSVQAYGAVLAYDDQARARATPSAPSPEPSRAGTRAGEGRDRPGRAEEPEEQREAREATAVPEASREAVPAVPEPSAPTEPPVREAAAQAERPVGPVLRILPLGSGLVLIGLGLGLAFVGLRLRRA